MGMQGCVKMQKQVEEWGELKMEEGLMEVLRKVEKTGERGD